MVNNRDTLRGSRAQTLNFNKIGSVKAFSIIFFVKCRKKCLPSVGKFFANQPSHPNQSRDCKKVVSRFLRGRFFGGVFAGTLYSGEIKF